MKILKTILVMAIIITGQKVNAQQCGITHSASVMTDKIPQYQTSFTINSWLKYEDSIRLIGTPTLDSNSWFILNVFSQPDTTIWF